MTATVPVQKGLKQKLKQLCSNLKAYRINQGISASLLAQKASITRVTLNKLEQGDLGVSVGVWLKVLSVLTSSSKSSDLSTSLIKGDLSSSNKKTSLTQRTSKIKKSSKKVLKSKPVLSSKTTRSKSKPSIRSNRKSR